MFLSLYMFVFTIQCWRPTLRVDDVLDRYHTFVRELVLDHIAVFTCSCATERRSRRRKWGVEERW